MNANYSIIESDPGPFLIHHTTGAISVTADLDYETTDFYQFHVHCLDSDQPSLTSTATVQVEVSSVNEFFPTVSPPSLHISVHESMAPGTIIASVFPDSSGLETYAVDDEDAWPHGVTGVRYTILGSLEDVEQFSLDRTTGTLVLTGSLDADRFIDGIHTVNIRINVCDDETQALLCQNLLVNLALFSVNDNHPQFSREFYAGTVPVSLSVGSKVDLGISCTDLDQGIGRFEGMELVTPSSTWEIDSQEGILTLKRSLNTLLSMLTVRCFDTDDREDLTTVTVNVNYHPKLNQSVYNFTIKQVVPMPEGLSVGNVSAVDINGDNITFSLVGNRHFAIIPRTGEIKLLEAIDVSEGAVFQLTVMASDGMLTDIASVQVVIGTDDGDTALTVSPSRVLPMVTLLISTLLWYLFV